MPIEEHIAQLKKLKSFHNGSYGASINFALDAMKKYQKIQEIYDNWNVDFGVETHKAMSKIGEVLEDGNDNKS